MKTITIDYKEYLDRDDELKKEKEFSSELTGKLQELEKRYKELSKEKGMIYVRNDRVVVGHEWKTYGNHTFKENITCEYITLYSKGDVVADINNASLELAHSLMEMRKKFEAEIRDKEETISILRKRNAENDRLLDGLPRRIKNKYFKPTT